VSQLGSLVWLGLSESHKVQRGYFSKGYRRLDYRLGLRFPPLSIDGARIFRVRMSRALTARFIHRNFCARRSWEFGRAVRKYSNCNALRCSNCTSSKYDAVSPLSSLFLSRGGGLGQVSFPLGVRDFGTRGLISSARKNRAENRGLDQRPLPHPCSRNANKISCTLIQPPSFDHSALVSSHRLQNVTKLDFPWTISNAQRGENRFC